MRHLEKLKPLAQTALRWSLAIIFFYHGYPKLFTQRTQFFTIFPKLGFPWYFVYLSGCLEIFGAALLAVGLFTRVVAMLLTGEMVIVLWKVKFAQGVMAVGNYQIELLLAVAAFTVLVIGSGPIAIDRLLFGSKKK